MCGLISKVPSFCLLITTTAIFFPTTSAQSISVDTVLTPLGTSATYTCTGSGDVDFVPMLPDMPGSLDTSSPDNREQLEARGIIFEENDSGATLTVLGSLENNGTVVSCRIVVIPFGTTFSDELNLIVIGPPLPPSVNSSLMSLTEILVEWDEPFTWPGYDVLEYSVSEEIDGVITATYNITETSHTYSSPTGEVAESCQVVTFQVAAVSAVGTGEPGMVMDGLPIALAMLEEPQISDIRFRPNGDPEVTISVQAPAVCVFQNATLNIEVKESNSTEATLPVRTETYTGQPPEVSVEYNMASGLLRNTNYSVLATVESVTGNVSAEARFDTYSSSSLGLLPVMWGAMWTAMSAILVPTVFY